MKKQLALKALLKFAAGTAAVGLLIFLPAGTWAYPQGWLFAAVLFLPMAAMGLVLLIRSPELLEKRLHAKEPRGRQGLVIRLGGLMFITGFILAGLDFRFGWLPLPFGVSIAAAVIFLLSYALYAEVLRENAYLSRTVEVQQGQKVIDTGLYGVVRHPMYSVTLVMFLMIPPVLGSVIALIPFLFYPVLTVRRLLDEEKLLEKELDGYAAYQKKVVYRLLPFIW